MRQEVEKYRKPVRILHWVHTGAFCVLFLTGLVLFIPALGFLAEDSWTASSTASGQPSSSSPRSFISFSTLNRWGED